MYLHRDNWHCFSKPIFSILINEYPAVVNVTRDSNNKLPWTGSFFSFIEFIVENVDS